MNTKNKIEEFHKQGLIASEIANILGITSRTVRYHIRKLGLKSNFGPKDISGLKYSFLTAIELCKNRKYRSWICICDCGNEKIVRQEQLINGTIKHCCSSIHKSGNLSKMFRGFGKIGQTYWNKLVSSALKRKIKFNLTLEEVSSLFEKQNGKCALSGLEINTVYPNHTASLDRIDSTKEYTIENVQWVHKDVNFMKMSLDQERLLELCKKITEYQNAKRIPNTL